MFWNIILCSWRKWWVTWDHHFFPLMQPKGLWPPHFLIALPACLVFVDSVEVCSTCLGVWKNTTLSPTEEQDLVFPLQPRGRWEGSQVLLSTSSSHCDNIEAPHTAVFVSLPTKYMFPPTTSQEAHTLVEYRTSPFLITLSVPLD